MGRQVAGWTERYARARTDEIPQIEAVAAWLAAHLPPESGAALLSRISDPAPTGVCLLPGLLQHVSG